MAGGIDWQAWHAPYADDSSPLARRRRVIQSHIRAWFDARPKAPVRVVSACAGDGRDLLEVLAERAATNQVSATLVELDPRNAAAAQAYAQDVGLEGIEVRCTDAGLSDAYVGAVPADLMLLCGLFGNISDADVTGTIAALPQLCAPDATVIWTRSRREPDLTSTIRRWLADRSFDEAAFTAPDGALFTVGVHVFGGQSEPLRLGEVWFRFVR